MNGFQNIASTLTETAARFPEQAAVVEPSGRRVSFRELDQLSNRLARGLRGVGVENGDRLVLMVRPGIEFISLTFALFKAGAVVVLIDPGMGPRRVFRCLDQVEPHGFVALSAVHAMRIVAGRRFATARKNVTVGRRWFWGGTTYERLAQTADVGPAPISQTGSTDPAAIIFTSGSTGPAKGVVYEHGMFSAQVAALRDYYHIEPGGVDLPGLPLFALFNSAMGVTTVIPDMDPTRPARVDPRKIRAAIEREGVTQGFGSPAIWNRVGRYCETERIEFPSLVRVFSAGAPVPVEVLRRMKATLVRPHAEIHTPYGATEALPVASITATQVLAETAAMTARGAGTCVGVPLPTIRLKIIRFSDGPIAQLADVSELSTGEIGEIIVQGAVVTREYFRQPASTANAKIKGGDSFWHRMGDVGYLDAEGRLWFCGRKSQTVETSYGRIFTDRVEPIINTHPRVARCALVGVGTKPNQTPVVVVELETGAGSAELTRELQQLAQTHETTRSIDRFLYYRGSLPVDVRHNTKINREFLAEWAARQ